MAISIEETAVGTSARGATDVTVTLAGAPSSGELIVLMLVLGDGGTSDGSSNLGTAPSGFTQAAAITNSAGNDKIRHLSVWYKVAGASEGSSYSFTSYSTGSTVWVKKSLFAIVASASGSEFDSVSHEETATTLNTTASTSTTVSAGSINSSENDALFVAVAAFGVDGVGNISWDSSFTAANEDDNTPAANDYVAGSAYRITTASGSYSTTATSTTSRDYQGQVIVNFNAFAASGATTATGTAAGTSTASAVGSSTAASTGTAAGTSTATAAGASTFAATGTAAGTSTATAVSSSGSTVTATGTAAGTSTATAVGSSTFAATGTAAGTSTATAVGSGTFAAVGAAAGTSTASAVGASTFAATGTAAGTSTASAVGASTFAATGTAAGTSTAAAVSGTAGTTTATGTAAATSTAIAYSNQLSLRGNLRAHTTARVGAAILRDFRAGGYFWETIPPAGTFRINQYIWLMTHGPKPLDIPRTDTTWSESQR